MFSKISEFLDAWRYETDGTLKILKALTDESLAQPVAPGGRSLGFIAWHITTTLGEMMGHAGVTADAPNEKSPMPAAAAAIAAAYEQGAKAVAEAVKTNWSDEQLGDDVAMYGETWKKGAVLGALIAHQCHHRGQMTVLMRQAGLKVPGVYGPAREEWPAYGMEAQP